jgi:RNA polymerase sigma-70 factor (ECF subfamily)
MERRREDDLAALAARARDGDQAAFRAWLEATTGTVFRVAVRTLGDAQAAEDVTQETYVRAWRGFAQLETPGASLGWVCRIARNVATDRLRSPLRREAFITDGPSSRDSAAERMQHPGSSPEEAALAKEERARVRAAVVSLAPKLRTVLLLREMDGMTYEEIATVTGVPRGTVESRIHRARTRLKRTLERAARRESGSRT